MGTDPASTQPVSTQRGGNCHRLVYLDNLRIALAMAVIVFHVVLVYAETDLWIYHLPSADPTTLAALRAYISLHHAYAMGGFFFLAGLFTPASCRRRGARAFFLDRSRRLGVPVLLYLLIVSPGLSWLLDADPGQTLAWGVGPMWFPCLLFLFTLLYLVLRSWLEPRLAREHQPTPWLGGRSLIIGVGLAGITTVVIRAAIPIATARLPILRIDPAYLPAYSLLFVVGLCLSEPGALDAALDHHGRRWAVATRVLLALWVILVLAGGALDHGIEPFRGGLGWMAVAYGLWETAFGLSAMLALAWRFRRHWPVQGARARRLRANAYAVYVVHPPVVLLLARGGAELDWPTPFQLALVLMIAVPTSWWLADRVLRRLPGARAVF